jgi:predicted AAA+ superfamily ATPase
MKTLNSGIPAVIDRDGYVSQMLRLRGNGLVKVLTGIRRCGKSYLLFNLFKTRLIEDGVAPDSILEIALDQEKFEPLRNPVRLGSLIREWLKSRSGDRYVFIDEIQLAYKVKRDDIDPAKVAPEDRDSLFVTFYDVLNELRTIPRVEVYVTGSNSKMLSSDVATAFRDRGTEIRIRPLRFAEYVRTTGQEKADALDDYLVWGGMPLAVLTPDESARANYLKSLFEKVYLKDIRERHKLRGDTITDGLLDLLFSAVGSLTNPHRLVRAFQASLGIETSDRTMKKHIGYLEDAFLFAKADRWDVKGRHYLDYPSKYYAVDTGLRNAKLNFRQVEDTHLMENAVYNELLARGCSVDVGVVEIPVEENGRTVVRAREIDFVVNHGRRKTYVQSSYRLVGDEQTERELLPLRKSGDFFRKIVVTYGSAKPREDAEGITHVGIIPFLLDESILG